MKSPFDGHPEYKFDPGHPPENFQIIERDDFKDFLFHHQGHQLENLKIIEDSFVSEKAYSEPIKTAFFKATNGRERFVVKKYRERIDEPLKYELVPGDYCLRCLAVEIQSEGILKQIRREVQPPLSQRKIGAFLKLMGVIVEGIDIKDLERIPEESHHPLEAYYKIDDVRVMYLLRNCRHIFKGQEYLAIEEFIHRHKDDGVLLLKATYEIRITQMAKTNKQSTPPALAFEKEKIFEKK
jgi:hypothetical protein